MLTLLKDRLLSKNVPNVITRLAKLYARPVYLKCLIYVQVAQMAIALLFMMDVKNATKKQSAPNVT